MPVMPSWVDYLPDVDQLRDVVREATGKAAAGSLPFADAAGETVRLGILADEALVVLLPHEARLREALASLSTRDRPDDIYGALALASAALIHDRLEDYDFDREALFVSELAARRPQGRSLACLALAIRRPDLAATFSTDARLAALGKGEADAYVDFVAKFPASDFTYAELGLIARAHVGARGGTWLRRVVRGEAAPQVAAAFTASLAEEAMSAIGTSEAMQVFYRNSARLLVELPALSAASEADHVFEVLALINVSLIHGGYVDGWYTRETRRGLEREIAILSGLAAAGVKHRGLAFAALGAGRFDLVRAFSDDATLARLATLDAKAYSDFVASFPTSGFRHAELGFVARAYAQHVEKRGTGGIGAGADWLAKTLREGPQPVNVLVIPEPMPRIEATWISTSNVHGLWGGRAIDIAADGTVTVIVVEPGQSWQMVKGELSPDERAHLEGVLAANDPRKIEIPMRNGIAGESTVSMTYVVDGTTTRLFKWWNDSHYELDSVVYALSTIGYRVAPRGRPDGK